MTDQPSVAAPARRSLPVWDFTLWDARLVTPRMMRLILLCPELEQLVYRPGQSLRISVPDGADGICERDYTIRAIDRRQGSLTVDVLLHGDTPGPRWARGIRRGDTVRARGPRSPITLWPDRGWYVLAGDETALPAILHMMETLADEVPARAFVEIEGPQDRMEVDLPTGCQINWIYRTDAAVKDSPLVASVLDHVPPSSPLPGQYCLIGQTSSVQLMRRGLLARGVSKADIAAEGYWRPGRAGGTVEALD